MKKTKLPHPLELVVCLFYAIWIAVGIAMIEQPTPPEPKFIEPTAEQSLWSRAHLGPYDQNQYGYSK